MGMRKRILLFLPFLAGAVWHWLWEFIRSILYDRGSRMMAPIIDTITPDQIIHWGPTIVLPILGLWLIWKTRPEKTAPSQNKNEVNDNTVDLTILVEWTYSKLPEIFPPSGKMCTVGLWSHASTGIGSQEASGAPGSKAPVEMQKEAYLCHVTNNGKEPLFHVEMEFTIIYHAIVEDHSGIHSGDVLGSSRWPLHILQLAPLSQGGSYDLYFWNAGPEIIEITLPKTAKVQRLGQEEWREVRLIAPRFGGFYISPNRASQSDII